MSAMRMFVAIPVPDALSASFESIRPDLSGLRWGGPGSQHLTLAFLGEVEEPQRTALVGELELVEHPAFELRVSGVGCFGGRSGRPRVLWAGVEDRDGSLAALRGKVVEALRRAGIERDFGRFLPHVTLARGRRLERAACRSWLERNRRRGLGRLPVREFRLFSSHRNPRGVEHRTVLRQVLGSPGPTAG